MKISPYVHYLVDLVYSQGPVDLFHGFAGVLHGEQGLLVDVGGFDRVNLVFEHGDLGGGLFEGVFVSFLAFEGRSGSCWDREI